MKPSKQQIHASNKLGLTTSNNKIYRQNIRPRTRAFQSCMAYTIHWPSTVQHKRGDRHGWSAFISRRRQSREQLSK